jgi:hypothetical protein
MTGSADAASGYVGCSNGDWCGQRKFAGTEPGRACGNERNTGNNDCSF